MGEDTRQGNVGGLYGIGVTLPIPTQKLYELVDQVRMGASMAGSLGETEVFLSILVGINPTRREGRDLIRKQLGEVRALNGLGDLGLRLLRSMNDESSPSIRASCLLRTMTSSSRYWRATSKSER